MYKLTLEIYDVIFSLFILFCFFFFSCFHSRLLHYMFYFFFCISTKHHYRFRKRISTHFWDSLDALFSFVTFYYFFFQIIRYTLNKIFTFYLSRLMGFWYNLNFFCNWDLSFRPSFYLHKCLNVIYNKKIIVIQLW